MNEMDYWSKSLIITSLYPGFQNFKNLEFKSTTDKTVVLLRSRTSCLYQKESENRSIAYSYFLKNAFSSTILNKNPEEVGKQRCGTSKKRIEEIFINYSRMTKTNANS